MDLGTLVQSPDTETAPAEFLFVEDINIGERFRKEYNKIDELCQSITQYGLMQYPVVDDNNNLIAGGRRMTALKKLGWLQIPVVRSKDISPAKLREMELEENLQRENLTWQEEISLKNEILRLKQDTYGIKPSGRAAAYSSGVSQKEVAESLNDSPANFSMDVALAKAMEEIPELAACSSKDEARKKLKQMQEQLIVAELGRRHRSTNLINLDGTLPIKQENPALAPAKVSFYNQADASFRIGDAIQGLKGLHPGQNIKYINVDTPYGIDLNAIKRDNGGEVKIQVDNYIEWDKNDFLYKDADGNWAGNAYEVAKECFRLADDNCSMTWWFAIQWYQPLVDMLQSVGWKIDAIPNIWDTGEQGQTNQPELYLARCYEPFFSCRKGQPIIFKRGRSNIFRHKKLSGDKKIHPTEKPLSLMKEVFETYASPGCAILIPFIGSGNDLLTGFSLSHSTFGFDLNAEVKKRFLIRLVEMETAGLL